MSNLTEIGSLEELATRFEELAKTARNRIGSWTPNMRKALLREQANTWERAASMVRGTTIVTKG
jgi:hypothetical protein